jgi:hypothetical protein
MTQHTEESADSECLAFGRNLQSSSLWMEVHVRLLESVLDARCKQILGSARRSQLMLMASFWQHYIEEAGFRFFLVHRNYGNPAAWGKQDACTPCSLT